MDERHWWIAGKIQESFHIGGFDNPTLLEDFLCQHETLDMINKFLQPRGPCRLFFYCVKPESGTISTRQLHITGSLAALKEGNLEDVTILYFLRQNTEKEVDASRMEKDIYCGELKGNTIEILSSMLSDIFVPLIRAQKEWGQCTKENQSLFNHNLDKVTGSLSESSSSSVSSKHVMLKQPENIVGTDFKQHRLAALDPQVIGEYEELVSDWMNTIEAILHDTADERFMDPNAGPLSELDRWKRRQRLLTSITEQLKGKECKAVIGVLITAKSRLLKRWKLIDSGITDAMNETKDKVRYLESLKRHLDQLYNGATPANIINSALPGLINTVKQMDSISRFYARQGFLGLLFTKVTNQLVLACKEYIEHCTVHEIDDQLWSKVQLEVQSREVLSSTDPRDKHFQAQLENKLKNQKKPNNKSDDSEDGLFARLKAVLTLQSYYKDSVRSLRDALGASQNLSHFTSLSSLNQPGSQSGRTKMSGKERKSVSGSPSKRTGSIVGSDHGEGHGVSVADEETIMSHLDIFCGRIRQIVDVINTMAQFNRMTKLTAGLPRPRKEDLVYDGSRDEKQVVEEEELAVKPVGVPDTGNLGAIAEDEDEEMGGGDGEKEQEETKKEGQYREEANDILMHSGLTNKDVELLRKYYPEHRRDEGPSISTIVQEHVQKMQKSMENHVTTKTMLDVESKDKDRFDDIYTSFLMTVQNIERFLAAYLNAIFVRKMRTHEALEMLTKFSSIQQRPGVRVVIAEKFVEIFNWYEGDLDEIQKIYEKYKDEPPVLRNAPPVAGAIHWSRQLLKRIEDPMKVFRDSKSVTHLKDFSRIVKIFNRLATALVTFESIWFTHWKSNIDHAKNGLQATLFVLHPETKEMLVNADEKVLELIHEAKWLTRLGINVPEAAQQIMHQESRFKGYRDHLSLCLKEFKEVCLIIPDSLSDLFKSHVNNALQNFQPGLSTLAWNSMNIDAFLHQIHTGTTKLKFLVEQVNEIMTNKVEGTIEKIREMFFFDYKLAFSKSWPPHEFTSVMGQSIKLQSQILYDYITVIETGIKECSNILTGKKNYNLAIHMAVVKAWKKWKGKALESLRKKKKEQDFYGLTGEKRTSAPQSKERAADKDFIAESEADVMVAQLMLCYRDAVYEAILMATTRSLVTLAESSGCEGEVIRAASALSDSTSNQLLSSPRVRSAASRTTSAMSQSERSRPVSILSLLSNQTWTTEKTHEITYLQFEVLVKFSIPNILIEPDLSSIQTALHMVAMNILEVPRGVSWCGADNLGEEFLSRIQEDEVVDEIREQVGGVVAELQSIVKQHIFHFSMHDFLWKDDMYGNYYEFIRHDPGPELINKEVERLLKIEKKVIAIPKVLPVGCICLHTDPIKDALHGFAMAWKNQYASVLHEEAKKKLDAAILYRSNVRQRLELTVANLDQLNSSLQLLEELRDMENKIDGIYLPIETMYAKLREFELRLPRNEVEEVDQLREKWQELLDMAEEVRQILLKEKRGAFEQELDKQVKTFVVEVIQFRNSFDAQGPAVPGITPSEAVARLQDFQHRYALYDAKRKTLDSVSKLFGIACKPFPELDKTGEELELLGMLYGLFQKFIRFDENFKDTLWAEVDLEVSTREVESYWDECLALPSKLKDWDAYNDMKSSIQQYRDVFPLLHSLNAKEIRNRHWLQVMYVTGSSFQLEAQVFRLRHLLDIGLIKHRVEIEEICRSASRELELEVKLRMTEEEWTEQVLNFDHYKKRGPMFLDKLSTERLLEQLEDAQALLAQMLTSRYIGPLREEAASWAEKLKEVAEVLEQWLEVQDLWQYLEAVFSNPDTAKELPQEAKRFARIDKGWTKMMKRAYDTRNVLQCCYGEEVPKGVVLRHIYQELEICFKSLMGYLDNKRRGFPRFFFVSDPVLLAILSRPNDLESVKPHLRAVFSAISDVRLEKQRLSEEESEVDSLLDGRKSGMSPAGRARASSNMSPHPEAHTPTKLDKRLAQVHDQDGERSKGRTPKGLPHGHRNVHASAASQYVSINMPSEMTVEDAVTMEAVAVLSSEGEVLQLVDKVTLEDGVEGWLSNLKKSVNKTLYDMLLNIISDITSGLQIDELSTKYPTQICQMGMLYMWTRECEQGVAELKFDRKAVHTTGKRFGAIANKLSSLLMRGNFRNIEESPVALQKLRLESMITQSMFLKDMIDNLANRKIRENTDFEWRRNLRFYIHEVENEAEPGLYILDQKFDYGCEFYGAQPTLGITPLTDKCFLSMAQAIALNKGSMVVGATGTGKTETVKGFAKVLGHFQFLFQCTPQSDKSGLGKVLQGLAMDGCWGCFDDVQHLSPGGLSVLVDHIYAIFGALKTKQQYCFLADGQEIPVSPKVAMFMTHNPSARPDYILPNDIRTLFRPVALMRPDMGLVLKCKCSQLGIKAPSVLALRLKLVAELAKDQLSEEIHHSLSVVALTGVLQKVAIRKKGVRQEQSLDKMDSKISERKTEVQDGSRSNSVMSTAPSNYPLQQSSSMLLNSTTRGGGKKSSTPNPLSSAAKQEHGIVAQTLLEVVGPRLTPENQAIFRQIVKDIFAGLPEPPMAPLAMSARTRTVDLDSVLDTTAAEMGLISHKSWREKCIQLYNISQVHQGIIIAGPPGSGKSTVVEALVDSLCVNPRGMSRAASSRTRGTEVAANNHKLQKVYPLVVDDLSVMFGYMNQNHEWMDGVFTAAWRKATRNQSTTWLCLDGPLNNSWVDHFSSVLDANKCLNLANGDQLFLSSNVKLLFETDNLAGASPGIVGRTGVVYVDKNVVGWKPIAKAWLENRSQQEVHVLQRAFDKTVDAVSHYVMQECRPSVRLCEVGMFMTCLNLLSAMLADNIEIGGELHIERLYLFCVMWAYGGLLDDKDRKGFNDLLATLSTALPDDDRDICFFDYYVDESGEWDPWHSRVPEAIYTEHHDLLGDVFIDTVDSIRTRLLMDFAYAAGQNVLLVGPPGSGKTSMINDFLDNQDPQAQVTKRLVYSGASNSKQLQTFIEANIYHRQGFVYGAKENKRLQLFVDDLNLPNTDEFGVQRCNEMLRRLLDDRIMCTLQKPFEWRTVEGLTILAAMSLSDCPSEDNKLLVPRLLRHFAVFHLPTPQDEALKTIVHGVLEATMLQGDHPGLDIELHNALVQASCKLLTAVKAVLRPTQMPGRRHYLFTLKDIITCFQCVKRLADESRADEKMVISLWKHETERVIKDRICRYADIKWYDEKMDEIIDEIWPQQKDSMHKYFVTFPVDPRVYTRPVTSISKKEVRVMLQPVETLKEVHTCLATHLGRYNEEFGNIQLNIMLSDNILLHVIKMHRVISYHHGGSFLLVGPIGSHLGTLIHLALHVADIPIHPIDSSKQNTFFDGLRTAVRLTGAEGKKLALFFTGRDLQDDQYLDAINSLLISGEYPHLFTNDEMDGLLQALGPAMKREHPNITVDANKFFVSRVKTNLHIMLCLPPQHTLVNTASSQYPGLLSGSQLIWMCDWTKESLLGEAAYYINKFSLTKDCESDLSESVMTCMANIHSFALQDCRQTKWAGDTNEEVTMTQVKVNDKKKDLLKVTPQKMPNRPYSKVIMLENIRLRHRRLDQPTTSELFIGPLTFRRFMDTFKHLYTLTSQERTEKVAKLKRVLSTLDQTRKDAKTMKQSIKTITGKFESAKDKTVDLMEKLTAKATLLEKLKAKVGTATSLGAFLQLNELSDEEEEEEDLLQEEERDEYDDEFERMREANLKTRTVQAKEEYGVAQKTVEAWRSKLGSAREQVLFWKNRVDRSCVERLRAFQNPPVLVGHVMEMVMTLIGKRLPSQRLEFRDNYPSKEEQSGKFSASSGSTKYTSVIKKPKLVKDGANERFDRAQWKSMQIMMTDSMKFVDIMHNVPWEDGLDPNVAAAVESYLYKNKDGRWGVTGEGTLLENAVETEKQFVAQRRSPSPENSKGITIAAAKYSSEDAATLVQYTIAIVEYTLLCGPLKAALERVHELEREIEENDRMQKEREHEPEEEQETEKEADTEEDLNEEDLAKVQGDVDDLQAQFDSAVVDKHSLEIELLSMKERLKAATNMVDSLKPQEGEWRAHVKEYSSNDILVANCIAASAFLTYCGGMNTDTRKRMGEFFMTICEHHGIALPTKKLFRNMELVEFLYEPVDIHHLAQLNLPQTRLLLENATFVMQGDSTMAWPLLCDPTSRAVDWVKDYLGEKGLVAVRYHDLRSQFDTCLSDGVPLLVTDIDINTFQNDARFRTVLVSRHRFIAGRNPFKIMVGDHEVECQPHFRMYLHTSSLPHQIPPTLAAYLSLIYFHQTRYDVQEELLDRFMRLEKSRLEEERVALLQERLQNMQYLTSLEKQMIDCLSGDVRLLNDLPTTKKMAELKKQHDETEESQARVKSGEDSITRAKESFRVIAKTGAVCFDTSQYLREISPFYQTSFEMFLKLYDTAISHSDRASVKAVVDRLLNAAFVTTMRSLADRDKLLYTLILAMELEDSEGRVGPGEREYLISPSLGSVTMTAIHAGNNAATESKFVSAKKVFDWMTDDQFNNLQILAIHYDWFQDMFERMPRDGRETQWRSLCESDKPELQPLPDKMDDVYTSLQRLLVIRAVRSDRIMQLANIFVVGALGKKFSGDIGIDLPMALRQSSPNTPILMLHSTEAQSALKMFNEFAIKKQTNTQIVPLGGQGAAAEKVAKKHLMKGMAEGSWVMLLNGHTNPSLLMSLESIFAEAEQVDPQFRCWVSSYADEKLPVRVLQSCIKMMINTPRTIKDTVVRSLNWMEADILKQTSRSEWPVLLHNLCYLHGALQLRARYGRGGWNNAADFRMIGNDELFESIKISLEEFRENLSCLTPEGTVVSRSTSWTGIRFMLSEVIYGNYVTDPLDQNSLAAMIDYWITPNAVKREFELARLKYKQPAAFFNPHPRLGQLIQAMENIAGHMLEVPEAANIHTSSETLLGDDQYIFTRLNKVFDAMPASKSLQHQLFPRAPTPFDGPPLSNVSINSNNPQVVDMGVFASASFATLRMKKEVELWEVCHNMLPKVPRAYSKEWVLDRIKKVGGFTSFNMFIMKEMDIMYRLNMDIRNTLVTIKQACEAESLGDLLTPRQLESADDLYHLRIPRHWCYLAGNTAPPPNQALGTWLNDLSARCAHFEKILVLGREKMPAYWLGAFFYPRGLLALLKQDCYRHHSSDRSGNIEQFVIQTEITARDKDHIRDPPSEGMFVFGIYLWGCAWEKTTGELMDAAPKHVCAALPVIHLTSWPANEKPVLQDPTTSGECYSCPVYQSRLAPKETILELDLSHRGIPAARWALRGLSATIRAY